jgi:hypothetical protein
VSLPISTVGAPNKAYHLDACIGVILNDSLRFAAVQVAQHLFAADLSMPLWTRWNLWAPYDGSNRSLFLLTHLNGFSMHMRFTFARSAGSELALKMNIPRLDGDSFPSGGRHHGLICNG